MQTGKLTVIVGCMFASKTDTLISLMGREKYRKRDVICFKPRRDNRYSENKIVSHTGIELTCHVVDSVSEIENSLQPWKKNNPQDCRMSVGIDETQFFDPAIAGLLSTLALDGFRVFASGLDLDSFGHPFGPMPELLAYADEIIKLNAQCVICGNDANRTYRKPDVSKEVVHVGGSSDYESRCSVCWKEI